VNWATFGETRSVLGEAFVRVLGYFREDGIKSVAAIEQAMRRTRFRRTGDCPRTR
jgi:hypothetical protein